MARTAGIRRPRPQSPPQAPAAPARDAVAMHLYCHGLGDCLLLEIPTIDPAQPFWMLIDCGIHTSAGGGKETIRKVVRDIRSLTDRLDVVVGTHEHWDHLSGFTHCEDLFKTFEIGEVWFGWTENPADAKARRLDKFKADALDALAGVRMRLGAPDDDPFAASLDALFGFSFGAEGERVRDAREKLRALSDTVRHLEPGAVAPLPPQADAVRIYVLGPPRDDKLFGITDSPTETYRFGMGDAPLAATLRNAMALDEGRLSVYGDPSAPFDDAAGRKLSGMLAAQGPMDDPDIAFLSARYAGEAPPEAEAAGKEEWTSDQSWRRIDGAWMRQAADLALQLDNRTNNTSLALAIEIVATGRVLIFAADAQVGNWKSWKALRFPAEGGRPETTGAELLKRAVFYKVGHHGSSNATLSKDGLELMVDPDLTAFIPTDEVMAKKVKWKDIPATALLTRLREKTSGRLIQSDRDWIQKPGLPIAVPAPSGSLKRIEVVTGLRVDLKIG